MNIRTFYFLQDTVSKKFYTGQWDQLAELKNAAVYYSKDGAKKGMGKVVEAWVSTQWHIQLSPDASVQTEVNLRSNLKNWGIEIVSGKVEV